MENNISKSYLAILITWIISSFVALFLSFFLINYPSSDIIQTLKIISCLLAGISSILSVFVVINTFNSITKSLLIIFPVMLFLCCFLFSNRVDSIIYDIYFIVTVIYFIIGLLTYFIKKNKTQLANSVFPFLYSAALMIIKIIELDRYVTLIDDSIQEIFLSVGFITAICSMVIYFCVAKNKTSKKQYIGNLFLTFFCVFVFVFGIPYALVKNVNYSFDTSVAEINQYRIIDKEYSHGGKNSPYNYYVIILYDNKNVKIKLPLTEYEKYSVNDYIELIKHQGAFNISYFEYVIDM